MELKVKREGEKAVGIVVGYVVTATGPKAVVLYGNILRTESLEGLIVQNPPPSR